MASSYSDLGLELMVTGENAGTWGDKTNQNINLIQQAVAGYEAVTLTSGGTLPLAMTDATLSSARNMVIKFATATIAASTVATIPDGIEKFYIFDCSGLTNPANLTIKTVSGTGFSPDAAKIYAAYSDGTNIVEISLDTLGGTIGSAQLSDNSVLSAAISANQITTAKISDNQITTAKISDNQITTSKVSDAQITTAKILDNNITTAKISDNQITTAKVSDLQITTAKIANDAVGPDQLSNTAVTAAEYTSATITVDAQGRITAASSGSAGGGNQILRKDGTAGGSGNVTVGNNANLAFGYFGGAGGGSGYRQGNTPYGSGGQGSYGMFLQPVSGGASLPYSLGSGGNGGQSWQQAGNAGNASNYNGVTANAGNGGGANNNAFQGTPGNFSTPATVSLPTASDSKVNNLSPSNTNATRGGESNVIPAAPIGDPGSFKGSAGGSGYILVYDNSGTA